MICLGQRLPTPIKQVEGGLEGKQGPIVGEDVLDGRAALRPGKGHRERWSCSPEAA
jgi:hypothetical protein